MGDTVVALVLKSHYLSLRLQARVHEIVREAVELEHEFCCEALSCALVGMNAELMGQYIEYVADRLLVALRCDKLWHSANPFDWMEMISLQVGCLQRDWPHLLLSPALVKGPGKV